MKLSPYELALVEAAYARGFDDGCEQVEAQEVGNGRHALSFDESWAAYLKELEN